MTDSKKYETLVSTETLVPSYINVITMTILEFEITYYLNNEEYYMSAGLVIGLATGGCFAVFVVAIVLLYIFRHMNFDSSDITFGESSEEFEMSSNDSSALVILPSPELGELAAKIFDLNDVLEGDQELDDRWLR